jgi:predicted transcriptional regulator
MSTKDRDRVIELWSSLSDEARGDVVEVIEQAAQQPSLRALTGYELGMIEKGMDDFKHGRTMTHEKVEKHFDAFFRTLAARPSE